MARIDDIHFHKSYLISSYLATGTRVTGSAPTVLGQYRSYLRAGSTAGTFSETNGAPAAAPSTADGVKMYGGGSYGSGDSSNQPSKYEIFVGTNKKIGMEFYSAAGRVGAFSHGAIFANYVNTGGGIQWAYNSSTGIVTLWEHTTSDSAGMTLGNDANNSGTNTAWFDIRVFD